MYEAIKYNNNDIVITVNVTITMILYLAMVSVMCMVQYRTDVLVQKSSRWPSRFLGDRRLVGFCEDPGLEDNIWDTSLVNSGRSSRSFRYQFLAPEIKYHILHHYRYGKDICCEFHFHFDILQYY